jgi:two-component system cell cycle sensor histidine kinase/response regulator CckA
MVSSRHLIRMNRALSLVHLEGLPAVTDRLVAVLEAEAFSCAVLPVSSGDALRAALKNPGVDLAICSLPADSGDAAAVVRGARNTAPHVPVIAVLAAANASAEVEILRAGAAECLSLPRLSRLGWSVRRALHDREEGARRVRLQQEFESLEAQLRHAQRLTNVARLAGGVAHDFNNLLTVINGCCQLLLKSLPPSEETLRAMVEPIEQAGSRGAELTRRLLAFSRQEPAATTLVNLNDVIKDVQPMFAPLIGETVRLSMNLEPSLRLVRADAGEITQILMNLVANARDAMPDGGTIVLRTSNVDLFSGGASPASNSFVELVVRDSGCGMSEEVRARIFDPFFTTKPVGQGTGIGLATVRRIVAQAGGEIDVDTAIGRGTAMRIRLPRAEHTEVVPVPPPPDELPQLAGTETVLVVEDESGVRRVLSGFLRAGGYRVLEASDADSARAVCHREGRGIDLLLSDVVLPDISGPRLAAILKEHNPKLQTLFISGYPADAISHAGLDGSPGFLAKPFSREVLLQRVRRVLGPRLTQ